MGGCAENDVQMRGYADVQMRRKLNAGVQVTFQAPLQGTGCSSP